MTTVRMPATLLGMLQICRIITHIQLMSPSLHVKPPRHEVGGVLQMNGDTTRHRNSTCSSQDIVPEVHFSSVTLSKKVTMIGFIVWHV